MRLFEFVHRTRVFLGATTIGVLITLISLFWIRNQQPVIQAELRAYDTFFYVRGGLPIPHDIVVVGVDQPSVNDLAGGSWPVPRRYTAQALRFLHRAHAKAVGLDFEYFAPSVHGSADTRSLESALKQSHNVVLESVLQTASASNYIQSESSIQEPLPEYAKHAAGIGVANISPDADGVNRWLPLVQQGPGGKNAGLKNYYSFPIVVASVALHKSPRQIMHDLNPTLPQDMYINFVGEQRPAVAGDLSFPIYQFEGLALGEDSYKPFRDKIVLIIPDTIEANDLHDTPVGQMFGGFIMANILNTILHRNPITPAGDTANILILLILGLVTTIAVSRFGIGWSTAGTLILVIGYGLIAVLLFQHLRLWINLVTPEITIVLIYAAVMALRFATEERLKRRLKSSFGLYLKPEIVDLITQSADPEAELAASRRQISVLFVDVRGFTSMSEGMQPEDVVRALDIYLEELTESVQSFDGMINKYVGDELIGMWNCLSIQPQPDHAMRAVRAGLDMVARMDRINEQLAARGLPAIKYGIGINSGEAVVGEMGSAFRKQFDVIGDTMNTGARLCSAAGGGEVIIGQTTWEMVGDKLVLEETEQLKLKGKSEVLRTFACLGLREVDVGVAATSAAGV